VVIGTNLFSRAAKKKKSKSANAQLPKLDEEYEEKLNALRDVLAKYDLADDFAATPEYQLLYTELVGTVQILLEDGLQ
jgi:hypothetical protein